MRVSIADGINDISAEDWDACALDASARSPGSDPDNPFLRHTFLRALEDSRSVNARTGWQPLHLVVHDDVGAIVGVAPCYLKGHSRGEYVFDHYWADAYERAGGNYYPKLLVAIPFTPVTGPRLLVRNGPQAGEVTNALIDGLRMLQEETLASSAHVNFISQWESQQLEQEGFLPRIDCQYHWHNEGFSTFDDFLSTLTSRKRKAVHRERREVLNAGITIERLNGTAITQEHWDAFYDFYQDTGNRKWGKAYIARSFYDDIARNFADRVLLVMAKREGRYIAGAINFIGQDTLFGRHWGTIEDHPYLHFEVCYYQALEFAIARGLRRVEAGAQGDHKLARGYQPVLTRSAHYIADPNFRRAVAEYLARERPAIELETGILREHMPFKQTEKI